MGNSLCKSIDPLDESTWEYERCRCHDSQDECRLATYRCEYITDEYLVNEVPTEYPELRKYWRGTSGPARHPLTGQFGSCYQYIGCDQCMTDQMKPFFTHHPTGWKAHWKCHIDYEAIKFPV